MGSNQIINYSLQPRATEIPTETSHNGRITEEDWFLPDRLVLPQGACGIGKFTVHQLSCCKDQVDIGC